VRPNIYCDDDKMDESPLMVVPLHQRLQLIRTQRGCSASEARRLLWDPTGEGTDPWSHASIDDDDMDQKGIEDKNSQFRKDGDSSKCCSGAGFSEIIHPCVLAVHPGVGGSVLMCAPGTGLRSFKFDSVFGEKSQQLEIYLNSVQRLVVSFLNGRNACVLAYGQTGSGKTHTMIGCMNPSDDTSLQGVVPRAAQEVLEGIRFKRAAGLETKLSVSYVEIYGEQVLDHRLTFLLTWFFILGSLQVTDLLHEGRRVGAWHGVAHRRVLDGGCQEELSADASKEELLQLLRAAEDRKRRAATAMNERSSRAHSVLIFRLVQRSTAQDEEQIESTICFADLGGSEQVCGRVRICVVGCRVVLCSALRSVVCGFTALMPLHAAGAQIKSGVVLDGGRRLPRQG
jgi:hypothetical protein